METASILICEDEGLVASDIAAALREKGYGVAGIASCYEQAISIVEQTTPDLALMDVHIDGPKNGIEVANVLQREYGIPSIYLTAYADDDTIEDAKRTLPLAYLLKPFDERELATAVEIGLSRHREENRTVAAFEEFISGLGSKDAIEKAVELERNFMTCERRNAVVRVASKLANSVYDEVAVLRELIEPIATEKVLTQEQRNALRGALIHQDRVSQVLNDVLGASADCEQLRSEVSLHDIVSESLDFAQRLVGTRIEFVDCGGCPGATCIVELSRIKDALVQICLNAAEAVVDRSAVTLGTSLVHEEFPERFNARAQAGTFACIRVLDSGRGIAQEYLERVFEPCFSHGKGPLHKGLGLSLAHQVLQQHNGWISIESTKGTGTNVSLYLPCVASMASSFAPRSRFKSDLKFSQ